MALFIELLKQQLQRQRKEAQQNDQKMFVLWRHGCNAQFSA